MIDREEEGVRYLPSDASGRRAEVAQDYERRQQSQSRQLIVSQPEPAPADMSTFWGGKKESPEVRRHNQQLRTTAWAEEEDAYALQCGLELEFMALRDSSRAIEAEVDVLMGLARGSLEYVITERLLFDSSERIAELNSLATQGYRRRVFGGQ